MARRRARIGGVGTGWWATQHHIPSLLENARAELVALADPDPARLEVAARRAGSPATYATAGELRVDSG